MKVGDRITIDKRVFIVRGVDPISADDARIYLEDVETGETVAESIEHIRSLLGDQPPNPPLRGTRRKTSANAYFAGRRRRLQSKASRASPSSPCSGSY